MHPGKQTLEAKRDNSYTTMTKLHEWSHTNRDILRNVVTETFFVQLYVTSMLLRAHTIVVLGVNLNLCPSGKELS